MLKKIKKLSELLQAGYSEKSVGGSLGSFFSENFGIKNLNIVLKEEYCSDKKIFPLKKGNKIIGYIELDSYSDDFDEFFEIAIPLISLKIQNIVLTEKMQRTIDFQHSMKNIAKIIETQYELNYIIPLLGEMIDKFIHNHLVYIFVKTKKGMKLMWPLACKDNKIFDIINAEPLKRVTTGDLGVFPLVCENKLLGYVVTKQIDEKLQYKDMEYLEELSKQSATTINRALAYGEILKHATLDALTGFYNRRQLEERIRQEIASSVRQKTPLCAIMTDIDFFKRVNDMGYQLEVTEKAHDFIAEKGWDDQYGARPLKRAIQKYVEDVLAEEIIRTKINIGEKIIIDYDDEKQDVVVNIVPAAERVLTE